MIACSFHPVVSESAAQCVQWEVRFSITIGMGPKMGQKRFDELLVVYFLYYFFRLFYSITERTKALGGGEMTKKNPGMESMCEFVWHTERLRLAVDIAFHRRQARPLPSKLQLKSTQRLFGWEENQTPPAAPSVRLKHPPTRTQSGPPNRNTQIKIRLILNGTHVPVRS